MAAGDELCLKNASRYCLGQETIKKLLEYLEFFLTKKAIKPEWEMRECVYFCDGCCVQGSFVTEKCIYIVCLRSANEVVSWFSSNDHKCNFANCVQMNNGGCKLVEWAGHRLQKGHSNCCFYSVLECCTCLAFVQLFAPFA